MSTSSSTSWFLPTLRRALELLASFETLVEDLPELLVVLVEVRTFFIFIVRLFIIILLFIILAVIMIFFILNFVSLFMIILRIFCRKCVEVVDAVLLEPTERRFLVSSR